MRKTKLTERECTETTNTSPCRNNDSPPPPSGPRDESEVGVDSYRWRTRTARPEDHVQGDCSVVPVGVLAGHTYSGDLRTNRKTLWQGVMSERSHLLSPSGEPKTTTPTPTSVAKKTLHTDVIPTIICFQKTERSDGKGPGNGSLVRRQPWQNRHDNHKSNDPRSWGLDPMSVVLRVGHNETSGAPGSTRDGKSQKNVKNGYIKVPRVNITRPPSPFTQVR